MRYAKIKELIDYFEQFELENGSQDISSFAYWLHQQTSASPKTVSPKDKEQQLNEKISEELGKLSNYAKHYVKKATKDTPLAGWNDMVAMIILYYSGSKRKTELIQMGLMDLSPGMEVIRRLLRLGLIEEFSDPDDGRAKQVKLTDSGFEMYKQMEKQISKVSQIIGGNLTVEEKQQLTIILEKLAHFHYPIWQEDADSKLDKVLAKYF